MRNVSQSDYFQILLWDQFMESVGFPAGSTPGVLPALASKFHLHIEVTWSFSLFAKPKNVTRRVETWGNRKRME